MPIDLQPKAVIDALASKILSGKNVSHSEVPARYLLSAVAASDRPRDSGRLAFRERSVADENLSKYK